MSSDSKSDEFDINNLQENFHKQQVKIFALKELVQKTEYAQENSLFNTHEKVKGITQRLNYFKTKIRSRHNLEQQPHIEFNENNENTMDDLSYECYQILSPQSQPPQIKESLGSEKMQLFKRQMEQNKIKMAERENNKRELEEAVIQLKARIDITQQSLDKSSELGRSLGDLTSLMSSPTPKKKTISVTESSYPLYLHKEKVEFLENRIRFLEEQLNKSSEKSESESNEKINDLQNKIIFLEKSLKEKECSQQNQNQSDCHDCLMKINELSKTNEDLHKKILSLESNKQSEIEIKNIMENNDSENAIKTEILQEEINKLINENNILKNTLKQNAQINKNLETTENEIEISSDTQHLLSKIKILEEQISEKTIENNVLNANLTVLQQKLKIPKPFFPKCACGNESELEINKLKSQLDNSNKNMIKMKLKIRQLQKEIQNFENISDVNREVKRLMEENHKLQQKLKNKVQVLEAQSQNNETSFEDQKLNFTNNLNDKEEVELFKNNILDTNRQETAQVMSSHTEIIQLEEQINSYVLQIDELHATINKKNAEINDLQQNIQSLEIDKNNLSEKIDHYIAENNELLDKVQKLSEINFSAESIDCVKLKEENSELKHKIDLFTNERSEILNKIEDLTNENQKQVQDLNQLLQDKSNLEKNLEQITTEIEHFKNVYDECRIEKENLLKKIDSTSLLEKFKYNIQKPLNIKNLIENCEKCLLRLNSELENYRKSNDKNTKLNTSRKLAKEAKNVCQQMNDFLEQFKFIITQNCEKQFNISDLMVKFQDIENSIDNLSKEFNSLKLESEQKDHEIQCLNEIISQKESNKIKENEKNHEILEIQTKSDAIIESLERKNNELEARIKELENINNDLMTFKTKQHEKLKKIASNLRKKVSQCDDLQQKNYDLEKIIEKSNLQLQEFENLKLQLIKEPNDYEEKISSLECQINNYQIDINKLETILSAKIDYYENQIKKIQENYEYLLSEKELENNQQRNDFEIQFNKLKQEEESLKISLYKDNEKYQEKINELQTQLDSGLKSNEEKNDKINELLAEVNSINVKLEKCKAIIKDKNTEIERLNEENHNKNEKLIEENVNLQTNFNQLKDKHDRLLRDYEDEKKVFQDTIQRLETLHDGIQTKLQDDFNYIKSLELENNNYNQKIIILQNFIESIQKKRELFNFKFERKFNECCENNDDLKNHLNLLLNYDDIIEKRLIEIEEENRQLIEQLNDEKETKKKLLHEIESKNIKIEKTEEIYEIENKFKKINEEKCSLEKDYEKIQKEIIEIKYENDKFQEYINELEKIKNNLEKENESLKIENNNLTTQEHIELQELRIKAVHNKTEIDKLTNQIDNLNHNHEIELNALKSQLNELDSIRMQISKNQTDDQIFIENENKKLKELLIEKDAVIENYQQQNLQLQMATVSSSQRIENPSNCELSFQMFDEEENNSNLKKLNYSHLEEISSIFKNFNDTSTLDNFCFKEDKQIKDQQKIEDLKRNVSDLEKHSSDFENKLKHLTLIHKETLNQMWEKDRLNEESRKNYEEKIHELEEKINKLQNIDINTGSEYYDDDKQIIKKPIISEKTNFQINNEFLQSNDDDIWNSKYSKPDDKNHYNAFYNNQIDTSNQIESLQNKLKEYGERIQELELERNSLEKHKIELQIKSGKMLKKLKEYKNKIDNFDNKRSSFEKSLSSSAELNNLAIQEELKTQLNISENKLVEIKKQLENEILEKQNLYEQVRILTDDNKRLMELNEKHGFDIQNYQLEIITLNEKIKNIDELNKITKIDRSNECSNRITENIAQLNQELENLKVEENTWLTLSNKDKENSELIDNNNEQTNDEIISLKQQVNELNSMIQYKNDEINNLKKRIETNQFENYSLNKCDECSTLKEEMKSLKFKIDSLEIEKNQIRNYEIINNELEEKLKQAAFDLDLKNIEIIELKNSLKILKEKQENEYIHNEQHKENTENSWPELTDKNIQFQEIEKQYEITDNNLNNSQIIEKLQSVLENQEIELVTLKEQLAIRSAEYASLVARHDPYGQMTTSNYNFSDQLSHENTIAMKNSNIAALKSELDQALYMLHQRDMRCEELSLELVNLLEERDMLQLKLSSSLRQIEDIKSKGTICDSPPEERLDKSLQRYEQSSPCDDSIQDNSELNTKLNQLHTVDYNMDKRIQEERDQRRKEMDQIRQDVSLIPPEATEENTPFNFPNIVENPSMIISNWLWGSSSNKNTSK